MALNQETVACSICLDLPYDPVTIPCGHSYCMSCIQAYWDNEEEKTTYSCPQCRKSFRQRPVLVKNTMLAAVVEELKKLGLRVAPTDHCFAGAEDVACDLCKGRKLKALKSCLDCLVSYCEGHLKPHYDAPLLKKHKLVEPCKRLQENICSFHNEVKKIFCRTDGQCICYLCSLEDHKGHDAVSAAAERTQRQQGMDLIQDKVTQRFQEVQKDLKVLQQEVEDVNRSADKAVEKNQKIFTQSMRLLEERNSDLMKKIRTQQETQVKRVRDVQEKLKQEMTELKKKHHEMKQLSLTEDHNLFLRNYSTATALPPSTELPKTSGILSARYFKDVAAAWPEVRGQLWDFLRYTWTSVTRIVSPVACLLPQLEPKSRF